MSDAVVIGSGLGGLLSGVILSRAGYRVTVLEKAAQPGGCLQTFVRDGIRFDTGFHSVAGLEEGGPLERIFRPLGLMDLPWEKVEQADEIVLDGVSYRLPDLSYPLGNTLRLSSPDGDVTMDEYVHVMHPFKNGSWRLPSGDLLVKKLVSQISGTVRTGCEVTAIEPGRGREHLRRNHHFRYPSPADFRALPGACPSGLSAPAAGVGRQSRHLHGLLQVTAGNH